MSKGIKKRERRLERHLRNKKRGEEHNKEAWENGKLIEENHNNGPYSSQYSLELCARIYERLRKAQSLALSVPENSDYLVKSGGSRNEMFTYYFRMYRLKVRDLILHWSPEVKKDDKYFWLKGLIERYWDEPDKLINYEI